MRRALLALFLSLWPGSSHAQVEQPVGFLVHDSKDASFVAARWPKQERFVLGSARGSELALPGLKPRHASFEVTEEGIWVTPIGEVELEGKRIRKRTAVEVGQTLGLGRYQVVFYRVDEDAEGEEGPAEPEEQVEETPGQEDRSDAGVSVPDGSRPVPPEEAAATAPEARRTELEKQAYHFCHDPDYGEDGTDGVELCAILDEQSEDACPEARKHCKEWKELDPISFGAGKGAGGIKGKQGPRRMRMMRKPLSLTLPALPPIVSYLIIGAAIAVVLLWFVRTLRKAGWEDEDQLGLEVPLTEAERNLQALPEARSSALIRLAERALERGDAKEAAILLHLAMLRHLDDEGLARYHPSKTNGDYLRAIRRLKELAGLFRAVAYQTERIRFGDGEVDPAVIVAQLPEARRLLVPGARSAEAFPAIDPAATLLLLGLGALSLQACGGDPDFAYHSHGPAGMSALPAVLRGAGLTVEVARVPLSKIGPEVGAVVIRTSAADESKWPSALRIDALLDRGLQVVVIDDLWHGRFFLPATSTTGAAPEGAVDLEMPEPRPMVLCSLRTGALQPFVAGVRLPSGRRLAADTEHSGTATATKDRLLLHPILVDRDHGLDRQGRSLAYAYAAERLREGDSLTGCLYVFSDRDLFTNASLARRSNASLVSAFFALMVPDGRKLLFLDRLDDWVMVSQEDGGEGSPAPNPAKALQASNMLPFILQGMAALIALYLFLGAAFGRLRDPAVAEHKAFIEHVEAIGRQYAKTGLMGRTHAARSLARLVVMRYRDQVRGGSSGGWGAAAAHLAHRLQLEEKDVQAALRLGIDGVSELGAPAPEDPPPASERMLRTLSRLLGVRTGQKKDKR